MKRTARLLALVLASLLVLAACTTAEEAGEAVPSEEQSPLPDISVEVTESEVIVETEEPTEEDAATTDETDTTDGAAADTEQQTIAEIAATNPSFGTLVQALEATGLTDTLAEAGPFTVFAPNDDAFAQLDQGDLAALLADPAQLGDILQYHVVEGEVLSSDLSDGDELDTLAGTTLPVSVDGGTVTVGDAEVVQADITAQNGVLHVIDGVLQP